MLFPTAPLAKHFAAQAVYSFYSLLIPVYIGRSMSTDDLASYGIFIAVLGIILIVPTAFLYLPVITRLKGFKRSHDVGDLFALIVASTIGIGTFLASSVLHIDRISPHLIGCYTATIILYDYYRRTQLVHQSYDNVFALEMARYLILVIAVHFKASTINTLFICLTLANSLAPILLLVGLSKSKFTLSYLRTSLVEVCRFANPLLLGHSLQAVSGNFYMVAASCLLENTAIAFLTALRALFGVTTVAYLAIENYLSPIISKEAADQSILAAWQRLRTTRRRARLISIGASLIFFPFLPLALDVFFGLESTPPALTAAAVMLLSIPITLEIRLFTIFFRTTRATSQILKYSLFGAISSIVSVGPLTYFGGLVGVAATFTISVLTMWLFARAAAIFVAGEEY